MLRGERTSEKAVRGGASVLSCRSVRLAPSDNGVAIEGPLSGVVCGYVKSGAVRFQIPELGLRAASAGHWFVLSVVDIASVMSAVEEAEVCMVECPQPLLSALGVSSETSTASLVCLLCTHRSISAYSSSVALGEERIAWSRLVDFKTSKPTDLLYQQSYMYEVVARLLSHPYMAQDGCIPCDAMTGGNRDEDSLCKVAAWLETHLDANHSLTALARRFGINECKLKRGFKGLFGTTVFGYLRRRRMEYAATRLEGSNATILEIAEEVGYSNPSHFSRAFEEEFGCLPRDFRRREQERVMNSHRV
jgi:AraC-like DNA-binding protein